MKKTMFTNAVPVSSMSMREQRAEAHRLQRLAEYKDRDLAMMKDPNCWPCWPFLPFTRDVPGKEREAGFIYDCDAKHTVFKGNIFDLPANIMTLPQEKFESFEELYEAGWRVN